MKTTISAIREFLSIVTGKIVNLSPASFGKFTPSYLPENYFYTKWINDKKDFTSIYLNMDSCAREAFIKYCGIETEVSPHSQLLSMFLLFCANYDSPDYYENPFAARYARYLYKKATGRNVINSGVKAMQVVKLFHKLDDNGKAYLVNCCFSKKKSPLLI